jgi:2-phosphosulfolactate phosphatase
VTLEVVFTPAELGGSSVGSRTAVVIDVLRSTSTIVEALASGAHAVVPVDSVELAVSKLQEIGRDLAILCGERDGQRIEGFHLGNSPLEFTAENVAGKTLVMTTTNGSRALTIGSTAERCLVGSYLNVSAVARAAAEDGNDVLLLCAGREGRFALEDALCAGSIANRIGAVRGKRMKTNDAARMSMLLARRWEGSLVKRLFRTAAGRHLIDLGRLAEIDYCAQLDLRSEVPAMRDRRVILQNS